MDDACEPLRIPGGPEQGGVVGVAMLARAPAGSFNRLDRGDDYPWGRVHEHWTDTDVLNAHTAPNLVERGAGTSGPWGQPIPQRFMGHASP